MMHPQRGAPRAKSPEPRADLPERVLVSRAPGTLIRFRGIRRPALVRRPILIDEKPAAGLTGETVTAVDPAHDRLLVDERLLAGRAQELWWRCLSVG